MLAHVPLVQEIFGLEKKKKPSHPQEIVGSSPNFTMTMPGVLLLNELLVAMDAKIAIPDSCKRSQS